MVIPERRDLEAWRRVPFADSIQIGLDGVIQNITGWTFKMQVRLYEGAPDPALVDLATVVTAIEGIEIESPGDAGIVIRIDQATLEAMPSAAATDRNLPDAFSYDLVATDGGGATDVWFYGSFTLHKGVTT